MTLDEVRKTKEQHGYYLALPESLDEPVDGPLKGLFVSVKDNICVKGLESTAGSEILKGYVPRFDATAVERLKAAGAVVIGKTSCDEFGFGSFNLTVPESFPVPAHPDDSERVTGGSSGGSAGATRVANFRHVALAESTGGSIVCPAAFCGVVGFCPTYGLVSRHGLISYADSLDKIGLMSTSVKELLPVLEVIAGPDGRDATCLDTPLREDEGTELRVGLLDVAAETLQPVKDALERAGISWETVQLPVTMRAGVAAYYILATSEASTNLARLSGLRYGKEGDKRQHYDEYFASVRTAFTSESKRRILLGTYARMAGLRDDYCRKAAQVRRLIIDEYKALFDTYDLIVSPTMPTVAPTRAEAEALTPAAAYAMDRLTVGPNIAGLPHATIPVQQEGLPVGLMATAAHHDERRLIRFLNALEDAQ